MVKNKDVPLSGRQLGALIQEMDERPNIIDDKKINQNSSIEDIFSDSGHTILFHDWGGKVGHWVVMVRQRDGDVYFFDSLGEHPNKYNKHIKTVVLKSHPRLLWNDIKFQKDKSNCCGRYAVLVSAMNKLGLKPKEIETELKKIKDVDKFIINLVQQEK